MQGFLADASGVELAATDSERCNRHKICPEAQEERRGGGTLVLDCILNVQCVE